MKTLTAVPVALRWSKPHRSEKYSATVRRLSGLAVVPDQPEPLAEWLETSLQDIAGRDPLGLNTITLDRILPQLLPGILQLSERARYFSIYPWMLSQFAERRRPATGEELDMFIRRREFELCLAMKLCKHCEVASAIGSLNAGPRVNAGDDPFQRGVSIQSAKGGFGLYYRSPLADLGAVAAVGTPLGPESKPTPVEVLRSADPRVPVLADSFHQAIGDTTYYRQFERSNDPIPRAVMEELAERICLCRLPHRERERDAVRALIFEPANDDPSTVAACDARRRGFALFLALVDERPEVANDTGAFWRGLIGRFETNRNAVDALGQTVAAWSALAMKECVQESICSMWTDFCRSGFHRQGHVGLDSVELRSMIDRLADAPDLALDGESLAISADESASEAQTRLVAAAADFDWNTLRTWTAERNTASSGLASLLVLADRVPDPNTVNPLWGEIAGRRSEHQDGLLGIVSLLRRRLLTEPTVAELLEWLIRRFIVGPHVVIAYSKLPKATFRFSWEETGRLRFFMPGGAGLDRFQPSDDRRQAMSTLSEDLGYWERGGTGADPRLTSDGQDFVVRAFG